MKVWKPRHLLMGWIAWWTALALWGVGSALPAVLRATRPTAKGNISVWFGDAGFQGTVTEAGRTLWHGTVSLGMLSLLIAVPPLLMWLFWLRSSDSMPADVPMIEEPARSLGVDARERDERRA
jgi:hypothetical protein